MNIYELNQHCKKNDLSIIVHSGKLCGFQDETISYLGLNVQGGY